MKQQKQLLNFEHYDTIIGSTHYATSYCLLYKSMADRRSHLPCTASSIEILYVVLLGARRAISYCHCRAAYNRGTILNLRKPPMQDSPGNQSQRITCILSAMFKKVCAALAVEYRVPKSACSCVGQVDGNQLLLPAIQNSNLKKVGSWLVL